LGFPQLPVAGKTHLSNTLVASEGVREFLFLALHPPKTPTTHTKNYPLHLPPATTAPSSTIPTSPTPAPAHTSNGDNPHNSHIPPSHSQTPVPPDTAPPTPIHTPPNALTPEHAPCPQRPDANHTPHEPQATSPPPPPATTNHPDTHTTCHPPTTPHHPPTHYHTTLTTHSANDPRPHTLHPTKTTPTIHQHHRLHMRTYPTYL
jgi:hypothetical protein